MPDPADRPENPEYPEYPELDALFPEDEGFAAARPAPPEETPPERPTAAVAAEQRPAEPDSAGGLPPPCRFAAGRWLAIAVLVILAAGTALRMRDFFQPWKNTDPSLVLKGFGGALYGTMARNHVRYGYRNTRLAMVNCGGEREVGELANHRYLNHPPLFAVLLSLAFHAFGVHEWSARLVPLVFSALSLLMLFVVVRLVAGVVPALLAMLLMAALPMAAYYGAFVEVQSFQVMFLSLALFYFYWKWHLGRRAVFLVAMFALFFLGAGFDWPIYLLAAGLFLHHVLAPGPRGRSKAILVFLPLGVVVAFGATLVYVTKLSGTQNLGALLNALAVETTGGQSLDALFGEGRWLEWPRRLRGYFATMYTWPVLILAAVWILRAAVAGVFRRAPVASGLVFAYLCMGGGYVLLFPYGSSIHEYWSMYLIPVFCVAAACLLCEASRWTVGVGAAVLAAYLGVHAWNRFEPPIPYESSYYVQAGRALQDRTDPTDTVAVLAIG
ncbi:MAG: glycosyltransferase family 39 protein, partial [Planctomycetes bacterium]|nr:glycosyltransferase family 39 protein [Planctomycetota bacterium]